MKHALLRTSGLILAAVFALAAPANAQTTASGPYYATPSWDQQLPAATRFIVLSNWASAAVLDRETGLVWEKSPALTEVNWNDAKYACVTAKVGGRKGWKLPSVQELASLVDPTPLLSPALPPGHPFTNVQPSSPQTSLFWASTTSTDPVFANYAWGVVFNDGFVGYSNKGIPYRAWCVRGGTGDGPQ